MDLRKWFLVLFLLGLIPGFYQLLHPAGLGLGPGREMVVLARNLVEKGYYGDSFRSLKTGPTATNPPLYPLLLALCFRLFRNPIAATIVILAANIVVNALVPALLPQVSAALWETPVPGIAGGALSILSIQLIPDWDANYTQCGLILFCLITLGLVHGNGHSAARAAMAGAALGVLFLLSQVVLLFAIPWIGFVLIVRQVRLRDLHRFLIPFLLAAILVNLPWLLRNYGIWGKFVTRTNFGMTLYASNNDCAEPSIYDELANGCYVATHPESSVGEATLLKSMGEPAYDRLKTSQAVSWILAHRARFFQLTLARIVQFWLPVPQPPRFSSYMIWATTALSIPGLFLMFRRHVSTSVLMAAVFFLYPLLYYVVVSAVRYRIPILWLSSLAAGYFLARFRLDRQLDG